MRKIMSSLDIGSNSIKLIVAEMIKDKINVLASSEVPANFMLKNKIVDKNILKENIATTFKEISEKLGFNVRSTLLIVPSTSANFTIGSAEVKTKSDDNLITPKDIIRVINQSSNGVLQDNMELVQITPINFTLDDGRKVTNPNNLFSENLSVKTVIATSLKEDIYLYLDVLEELGIDVVDIAFDSIGDYYTFQGSNTEDSAGVIINIGASKTTVSIFNKGVLTNTCLINLGGNNIDKDIAYIYKIDKNEAKKLKETVALATPRLASSSEVISLTNKEDEKININQYEISEIVNSRLDEILNITKKQINILTKKEIRYIICTGGVTNIKDFNLLLEDIFGKNVTLGSIHTLGVRNNKYSSALGLIKWYNELAKLKNKDYSILSIKEQEEFSKEESKNTATNNGIIGHVFDYFFDN